MAKTFPLEELSINQIYLESQEPITYIIPVYQRNYAWEESEISTLIKDVYDSSLEKSKVRYYIGTLVTYNRGERVYEVIDGQQRLTTIYIILNVLANLGALDLKDIRNKLTYSARKKSASTIEKLRDYSKLGNEAESGIKNGCQYAEKAIKEIIVDETKQKYFAQYFLQNVYLIHYNVPQDVDLNHYFEVMNSRGEQLEKHEIVKSILCQHLKNKREMATFSRVWEACSEMSLYIQQSFTDSALFGNSLNEFKICSFTEIPLQGELEGKSSIKELLNHPISKVNEASTFDQNDRFQPIIDFPNFLLIVLKVTMMKIAEFDPTEFRLDDKYLLEEFKKALNLVVDEAAFAREFAFNLLKAKFLLDNYIVHHAQNDKEQSGDNPWKLQYYFHDNKNRYPKNLSDDLNMQLEMVHLLSMFEVSFTPKQRKNYLFYCMLYLFDNYERDKSEYLLFLQRLADKYFYDVYLNSDRLSDRNIPRPNAFDSAMLSNGKMNVELPGGEKYYYRGQFAEIYKQGNYDVPLFVFNYTDYKLWKKYAEELRSNNLKKGAKERTEFFMELGCSDFELDPFNNFYFSRTRKSLEHFYPQAKAGDGKTLSSYDINCFGNFAMIGAEVNCSGSNLNPSVKYDRYKDSKSDPVSIASLKFIIMMQMCLDNRKAMLNDKLNREFGMEWNAEDMQIHQNKMLEIIIP